MELARGKKLPQLIDLISRVCDADCASNHFLLMMTHTRHTCCYHVRGDVYLLGCLNNRCRRTTIHRTRTFDCHQCAHASCGDCENIRTHTNLNCSTDTCSYHYSFLSLNFEVRPLSERFSEFPKIYIAHSGG